MKKNNSGIDWEQLSFSIITAAGSAKSAGMEALYDAKAGKFKEAEKKMQKANLDIAKASGLHFEVITKEAQGVQLEFRVLFMHAEDQMLTTQTLLMLVEELIDVHRELKKKK